MSSVDQFLNHLNESGVWTSEEVSRLEASFSVDQRAADAQSLAKELVQQGKLTRFQASVLYQGKLKVLNFGEYVVVDRIGAGGMGQVYKAQHRRMKRHVALKVLSSSSMKSADAVKRFQREVEAAARLNHPNIVTAHDAGEQHGTHYLVMELVEGSDLASILKERGPLPIAEALHYLIQAGRGLAYAHSQGIVHRDIKPGNLLVDKQGTVKILDMGLARFDEAAAADAADAEGLTQSGQVMGTVDYMAPEQALNTHGADARADIYSLGCTFYRLLTGKILYEGQTVVEKIVAHRERPLPDLRELRPDVSDELTAIYRRMVAKRPDDRFASMNELLTALERLQESGAAALPNVGGLASGGERGSTRDRGAPRETATDHSAHRGGGSRRRSVRGNGAIVAASVGIVLIGLLVGGWWLWSGSRATPPVVVAKTASSSANPVNEPEPKQVSIPLSLPATPMPPENTPPAPAMTTPAAPTTPEPAPTPSPIPPPPPRPNPDDTPPPPRRTVATFELPNIAEPWGGLASAWSLDEDGVLHGKTTADGGTRNSALIHALEWDDFELRCELRVLTGDSGIYVRSELADRATALLVGPQVDAANGHWGNLIADAQGTVWAEAPSDQVERLARQDDFNTLVVRCVGSRVTIQLNDETLIDREFPELPRRGHVGFQLHGREPTEVAIRAVRLTRIEPSMAPPRPMPDAPPADTRATTPDLAAIKQADSLVRELFKSELQAAAKRPEDKAALIEKLLEQANRADNDPPGRYATLRLARELLLEIWDADLLSRLTGTWARWFIVQPEQELLDMLLEANKKPKPPLVNRLMADAGKRGADLALEEEQFELAKKLSDAALVAARNTRDAGTLKQFTDWAKEVSDTKGQADAVAQALKTLEMKPDDPATNLLIGRDYCLNRDRWSDGLPYLAKGSDKQLADLAKKALAAGESADERAAIGDAWWQASESATGKRKIELQTAARYWYQLALPTLTGLVKAKIEKRLAEFIPPLKYPASYMPLFNGRDLTGWVNPSQDALWTVQNGMITARADNFSVLLTQRGDFQDFHLRAEVIVNDGGNGGLHFRLNPTERRGYEAAVATGQGDMRTGSIYVFGNGDALNLQSSPAPPATWFLYEVICRGQRIQTLVNGRLVGDVTEGSFSRGHIGLEIHDSSTQIGYRNITIREFPPQR